MIVDLYTHIAPRSFLDQIVTLAPRMSNIVSRLLKVEALSNLEARFRAMDDASKHEYRQLISLPNPPLEEIGTSEAGRELARIANDEMAELCHRYPERFIGFAAAVHLTDVDAAIAEAERAIHTLGAKGVLIYTHIAGHPLDEPRFRPFFAAMSEWDRPLWLHPTRGAHVTDYASETKSRFEMWWCFGWPYDTSVAMSRLVFDGLFDRHPELKIITHHCGGLIPFFDGRIGAGMDLLGARTVDEDYSRVLPSLQRPHLDYFKLFYGDTAMFGATTGVKCGLDFFGARKIVFATDAPFGPIVQTCAGIEEMNIAEKEKQMIFSGNASMILGI
jgi:predicted TIM-barrel fold metal-dependent hydrolase